MPKDTAQYPRPGLEPGVLAPESSTLTMRAPSCNLHSALSEIVSLVFFIICCYMVEEEINPEGLPYTKDRVAHWKFCKELVPRGTVNFVSRESQYFPRRSRGKH